MLHIWSGIIMAADGTLDYGLFATVIENVKAKQNAKVST